MTNRSIPHPIDRRSFLRRSIVLGSAAGIASGLPVIPRLLAQTPRPGNPLRLPADWTGDALTVAPASLPVWPGFSTDVFAVNGSVPGPTIRVRRGQEFAARIDNRLPQPLVLHWHGILAPERMDGHPRDAVPAGRSYEVRFPVDQRASTSWYHAHTDLLTAEQVYAGLAGLFIVEDPEEQALDLPRGDHDVPLVIADRRGNPLRQFIYAPTIMDIMRGYLGDLILVNGTPEAWLSVFVYGITEKLAAIGIVPYLDKTLKLGGGERGANGLGDATLLGRYQVVQWNRPGETFRSQLLGGLEFPAGADDKRDGLGRLPPSLQLGSGSYDLLLAARPLPEDRPDLFEFQSQLLGLADETQPRNIRRSVNPVTRRRPFRGGQQAQPLVVAQRVGRGACLTGQLANAHGFGPRRGREGLADERVALFFIYHFAITLNDL